MSALGWRDISVYGQAVMNHGLCVQHGVSGVGLVSRGFIYGKYDIYIDAFNVNPISTSWTDSEDVISTSWTDSQTLAPTAVTIPSQATTTVYLYRPSVQYGEVTVPANSLFTATNGQKFRSPGGAALGSSGFNSWVLGSPTPFPGIVTTVGSVYRDDDGHLWTVATEWDGIHAGFETYGATLNYNTGFVNNGTLTKVSGTGEPVLYHNGAIGEDFYTFAFVESELVGTQANVPENSISLTSPLLDPTLTVVASNEAQNGDGTGWTDSNFGMYSEAFND